MKTTKMLREMLEKDELIVVSACYNTLGALILEKAGLKCISLSGNTTSSNLLGRPDLSLLTAPELVQTTRYITNVVNIPIICDADTGYGGVHNVMQAVKDFEVAGAAAVHIEDQVFPKRCGFIKGIEVVSIDEACTRYKAATKARKDSDFMIIARTDARAQYDVEEAIKRANAYLDAGADMAYVEGLKTKEEIEAVAKGVNGPKFFSVTEYRPWTNISRGEIKKLGFNLANYPMTLTLTLCKQMMEFADKFVKCETTVDFLEGMANMVTDYEAVLNLDDYLKLENELINL